MPTGGRKFELGDKCKKCDVIITGSNATYKSLRLLPYCDSCFKIQKESYPSRTKGARQANWMRWKFGLSVEEYNEMKESQLGVCAICNRPEVTGRELSVDHNHTTGQIRGLLCYKCNTMLGHISENEEILIKMIFYLRQYREMEEEEKETKETA